MSGLQSRKRTLAELRAAQTRNSDLDASMGGSSLGDSPVAVADAVAMGGAGGSHWYDDDAESGADDAVSDDHIRAGGGVMRSEINEHSQSEDERQQARRRRYTHTQQQQQPLQPQQSNGNFGNGNNAAGAAAPRPDAHYGAAIAGLGDNCPICNEQFEAQYEESRLKSNGTRQSKTRGAVQQLVVDRYRVVFSIEALLRGHVNDGQLLPLLLKVHHRLIEKPLLEQQIDFVPWTLPMLLRHFDPRNPHILDPLRTLRHRQNTVNRLVTDMEPFVFEPDPANIARRVVNAKVVSSLNTLIALDMKLLATIRKMQTEADDNIANAIFSLISTLSRLTAGDGVDEAVLHNPQIAAGTTIAEGSAIRTANNGTNMASVAANMYAMSGF